jgi:hypothetical protein
VKSILVDAGPLIALFDRDDKYHAIVISFLHKYKGRFITTWPVITEVSHMLSFSADVQIAFLEWLRRDALDIVSLEKNHLHRIIELSKKYSDVPMDLADSSLLVVSEMSGIKEIMTIDSDYYIYRIKGNKALKNVLSDYLN